MFIRLLTIFATSLWASAPLDYVRVFYKSDGTFLARNVYQGQSQPKEPGWSQGFCDIQAANWDETQAHGRKRVVPASCTFVDAPQTPRQVKVARMKALLAKWQGGTVTGPEKDELLRYLVELFLASESDG